MTISNTIKTATVLGTVYTLYRTLYSHDSGNSVLFSETYEIISTRDGFHGYPEGRYGTRSGAYKAFRRMTRN